MLAGLLSFSLILVVGYALFSESLAITGTATAQGSFDLTYECVTRKVGNGKGEYSIDNEKNTITTTSTLTKPTDGISFLVKITNTGTIPVIIKTVTSSNNFSNTEFNAPGDKIYLDKTTFLSAQFVVSPVVNADNTLSGPYYVGDTAVENANLTIQPGETIGMSIFHSWHDSGQTEKQPSLPEDGATINYDLTFEFQQKTT